MPEVTLQDIVAEAKREIAIKVEVGSKEGLRFS